MVETADYKEAWGNMGVVKLFYILIVIVVIWLYVFAETHKIVHTQKKETLYVDAWEKPLHQKLYTQKIILYVN